MSKGLRGHFFSHDARNILFQGRKLDEVDIHEISSISRLHVIPDDSERYYYESLIYAIGNQRINYERVFPFMRRVNALSMDELKDPRIVYGLSRQNGGKLMWKEDRFTPAYEYMQTHSGIESVVKTFLQMPHEVRNELDDIKWLGLKTLSLWYLCLGGDSDILCLDVHNTRQAASLGLELSQKYYIPKRRKSGLTRSRIMAEQISGNDYLKLEKDLAKLFLESRLVEEFPSYLINASGKINGLFVSAMLWWPSVRGVRGESMDQYSLFDDTRFISPYGVSQ
jgi:hypothetical protein